MNLLQRPARFLYNTRINAVERLQAKAAQLGGMIPFAGGGMRGGVGNYIGQLLNLATGSTYNFRKEAGPLHQNRIVLSCLKAMQRMVSEVEIVAQKRSPQSKGAKWSNDYTLPLSQLLANPNPHFDCLQLLVALLISYVCDGNAYLWKRRSAAGKVVELWYIPHHLIEPVRPLDGSAYCSHYEYRVNGRIIDILPEDVIHIKNGIDPDNDLKGLSDLGAVLREICTDNEAGAFTAALLKNMGVPGVIISPKAAVEEDDGLSETARQSMIAQFKQKFTGKNRGEPWIQSVPLDVTQLGFNPKNLDLAALRRIPEASVTAAIGLPAVVVGMLVGLETSTAKASYEASLYQAYVSCIIPLLRNVARQMTRDLVNDAYWPFGDLSKLRVWFDTSAVQCLQDDLNAEAKRYALLYGAGICKRSEAQEGCNVTVDEAADGYAQDFAAPVADVADEEDADTENE